MKDIRDINISSVREAEEILKAAGSEDLFEKAKHQDGDVHPNGKWVWRSSAAGGKGDWRTIKNAKKEKKEDKTNTAKTKGNVRNDIPIEDIEDIATKLSQFAHRESKKDEIIEELKNMSFDENMKPTSSVSKLTELLDFTSDIGTENYVRVGFRHLKKDAVKLTPVEPSKVEEKKLESRKTKDKGEPVLNEQGVHKGYLSLKSKNNLVTPRAKTIKDSNISSLKEKTPLIEKFLKSLPQKKNPEKGMVPKNNPDNTEDNYILVDGKDKYFVDTQGYDYPRYMLKIN